MAAVSAPMGLASTTSYKVVLPFYGYAMISFLVATLLLLAHTDIVHENNFNPYTLTITHIMALGWGTMIILGASHQLLPVLIEGKLDSDLLAYLTFVCTAIGIPILAVGFYQFQFNWVLQTGAVLVNLGILFYIINVFRSIIRSKKAEVHAWYMAAASLWLFSTTILGLILVFNFSYTLLPANSVSYLSVHAHLGIIGWFLMLVIGVASRLIPLFLISKYSSNQRLWEIFILINSSLISFIVIRFLNISTYFYYIPAALSLVAIGLFGKYCRKAYWVRIRKNVDEQVKTSLLSIVQMAIPILVLLVVLMLVPLGKHLNLIILYGFCIFFGWISAIILGMTFKTLPFIVWNKVYSKRAHGTKTPAPKELFNEKVYKVMIILYLLGYLTFVVGILFMNDYILKTGALALVISAVLYVYNTSITLFHKI